MSAEGYAAGGLAGWIRRGARIGWVARGVVYMVVGVLAVRLVAGPRFDQEAADQAGALRAIAEAPAGAVLLVVLAGGLATFAAWQAVQLRLLGGVEVDAWFERVAKVFGIFFYGSLAWTAIRLSLGDTQSSSWTVERVVSWTIGRPFGRLFVAPAAVVIVGVALRRAVRSRTGEFTDDLHLDMAGSTERAIVEWLGRAGEIGRSISFVLIAWFLFAAAWSGRSDDAGGLDESLYETTRSGLGEVFVVITGLGFVLFGAFSIASARHRSIDPN